MSRTYCRFCDITVEGLYLHCPRCGGWLPPKDALPEGEKGVINSEPFELVEFGKSWDYEKEDPLLRALAVEPQEEQEVMKTPTKYSQYNLPVRITLRVIETALYLIVLGVIIGALVLVGVGIVWMLKIVGAI